MNKTDKYVNRQRKPQEHIKIFVKFKQIEKTNTSYKHILQMIGVQHTLCAQSRGKCFFVQCFL